MMDAVSPMPLDYAPTAGRWDEAVAADGSLRPPWQGVVSAVGLDEPGALRERRQRADRLLDAEGAGHLVHEGALWRRWRLDPVPLILPAAEFGHLAAAAIERMQAAEALLADCYGPRTLVASGAMPADLLHSLTKYRHVAGGYRPAMWLVHYAVDVVRVADGRWHVVADLTDTPSGLGETLLHRSVMARVAPEAVRATGVAAVHDHADTLRQALAAVAPTDRQSPRSVVLTPGPADADYVEHSHLARRLGLHLVESGDVVMRGGRLWLRVLDGLEPIDVVYRRVADAALDPLDQGHHGGGAGVPGIVWGARKGGVTLANAYGAGLLEAAWMTPFVDVASRQLLGRTVSLPQLPEGALLASAPVLGEDERLSAMPVVLRLQVTRVGDEHVVMQGGTARVLLEGDRPTHPTSGLVKDVWVTGAAPRLRVRPPAPPQVDFGASVPKRVADSMYWLGRAAERAEVAARTARVVGEQLQLDPMLAELEDGSWSGAAVALLRAARSVPIAGGGGSGEVPDELAATARAASASAVTLVQEAASVREYLSITTGRLLGRLARSDDLEGLLVDLAALSGLSMESTVRGPSWRFLDLGRRVERAFAVLGSVEAALAPAVAPFARQPVADAVLASNESLVAYRRRHRSEVDLGAVLDLLLHDDTNPRSLAFQLDRLREHAAGLGWPEGMAFVDEASARLLAQVDRVFVAGRLQSLDALVVAVRTPLLGLVDEVVRSWFADPVNPTAMRGF